MIASKRNPPLFRVGQIVTINAKTGFNKHRGDSFTVVQVLPLHYSGGHQYRLRPTTGPDRVAMEADLILW
ncbi:MAG: hypothetical protein JWM91_284 [Rhodospirillales bacterium]|nr:hypothetical protein [Rhodospirillales bacterium]